MAERRVSGCTNATRPEGPCTFLLESTENVTVRGRAEWMTADRAYVVVPYGTARSLRQCWDAVAVVPDARRPGRFRQRHMTAELVAATQTNGLESEQEGLLLRLNAVPAASVRRSVTPVASA